MMVEAALGSVRERPLKAAARNFLSVSSRKSFA